ncbi:MAG: sulfatase-like hydrolase/transferase [Verrucomicrobiota bacterium]|nr:sulfatase-like hydrolase/transferase [Verrucomicrobiota bacterium]
MKIRFLLLTCFFTFLFKLDAKRPNIVFFFTDDQTSSSLGCYGHPLVKTPHIDRLAKEGTRFANAFVSQSICWVSRTTILTGLTGRSYGVPGNHDMAKPEAVEKLYVDYLRDAGYRTGFAGKWHAKMPKGWKPQDHFDVFQPIGRNPFYKKQEDGSLRHETELIVDKGIEFIETQPADQPFSLNMWFNACHAEDGDRRPGIGHFPWPRAVDGMYEEDEIAPPRLNDPKIFEEQPDFLKTTINRERFFWRWNTDERYRTNMRAYLRMVSGIDNAIGRFIKTLQERGLADNTIIVYTADNGFHMGNRGFAGKWSHYEESLRVPMVVFDPRVKGKARGQVRQESVLNLDLPSTFLNWAGIKIPERYQGKTFEKLVSDSKVVPWRDYTFHEHFAVRHRIPAFEGLRGERYKYVRYVDEGDYEFLHDLQSDPDELINLAGNLKHRKTLQKMRQLTDQRVEQLGGPLAPMKGELSLSTVPQPESAAQVANRPGADGFANLIAPGNRIRNWSGDSKFWSKQDGVLIGKCDGSLKMNRFITWKAATVRNFDLRVKVRISSGGNSGIQYRGTSRPDLGLDIVTGYQCDVVANVAKYNGMLYEEKGRRILSHTGEKVMVDSSGQPWIVGNFPVKNFEPGQWHEYRVLVEANRHRHWIDGHPTADLIDFDEKGRVLEGVLAMQVHVGPPMTVEYKEMRIKHLPDNLPLLQVENHPIPKGSRGVRPQGRLPKDWKALIYQGKR